MRVTADTNVYISALMFGGLPGHFLDLAMVSSFRLLTSPAILEELHAKLLAKFKVQLQDAEVIGTKLKSVAELVRPHFTLDVITDDPDDNRILECAIAGRADYVVSGDRHLLRLKSYEDITILTVRQFLEILRNSI